VIFTELVIKDKDFEELDEMYKTDATCSLCMKSTKTYIHFMGFNMDTMMHLCKKCLSDSIDKMDESFIKKMSMSECIHKRV